MRIYIISAFPERLPPLLAQLKGQNYTVINVPAGRAVREAPDYRIPPSPVWRDTEHPKPITWGEVSCLYGHMQAWKQIEAEGEPAIVLEDDAKLVGPLPTMPEGWVLHYLGWKNYKHVRWWTIGYALIPEFASVLIDAVDKLGGIPADEILPWAYGAGVSENRLGLFPAPVRDSLTYTKDEKSKVGDTGKPIVVPRGAQSATDTQDWATQLIVLLCATDRQRAKPLIDDLEQYGYTYAVLGKGQPDWNTEKEGGRCKLEWLQKALAAIPDETAVMLLDAYDVRVQIKPQKILEQWGALRWPGIVAGEKLYWPNRDMQAAFDTLPPYEGEDNAIYPYPCSGTLICARKYLFESVSWALDTYPDEKDDQALVQRMVLQFPNIWRIDREGFIFRSMNGAKPLVEGKDTETGCSPGILHFNGPQQVRKIEKVGHLVTQPIEVADGVLAIPLLGKKTCADLAEKLNAMDGWRPLTNDKVPGDEIRLKAAGLYDVYAPLIENAFRPIINQHWAPTEFSSISDLFAIRYEPHRQDSLRLHTDLSRFSASILLEAADEGGILWLPRQNFRDDLVPVGTALVFPSRVTHPHAVTPVTAGRRISLVVWTKT